MLDPLTALGVAASAVQFVDFVGNLVSGTLRLHRSRKKNDEESADFNLKSISKELIKLNKNLLKSLGSTSSQTLTTQDHEITKLCEGCNRVAMQLIAALERLKGTGRNKISDSFLQALRTIWSESEIESLKQTINSFRYQISMHILVSLRDRISANHAEVLTTVERTQNTVEEFMRKLEASNEWKLSVVNRINETYLEPARWGNGESSPWRMKDYLVTRDSDKFGKKLLSLLQYPGINHRRESVVDAYHKTFEWVFQPPDNSSWSDFTEWLKGDGNLYWVTGKPASGKSTLMKFIYNDPRTRDYLQTWSSDRQVLISGFYFWNSGSQLQMSQEGFARTLLHETLRQAPELIPVAFPQRMEVYALFGDHATWSTPWSWNELFRAFQTIVKTATIDRNLMFFIDGLDEFDGNHAELVSLVQGFLNPNVKACVSSRPWNVFEDGFRQQPSLRMEDLTRNDIRHYVHSRFSSNPGFVQFRVIDPVFADQLVEDVATKSRGVFLWVSLVTHSLMEGLSDGDRLPDLQKRLNSLPVDLEALFWRILTNLHTFHLKRMSQFLQIIRASARPLTMLGMSYADEENDELALGVPARPLSSEVAMARAGLLRRRLNACCKGLVEADRDGSQSLADSQVGFLHRTLKDYLEREEIWSKFVALTDESFDPYLRLCNAEIVMFKIDPIGIEHPLEHIGLEEYSLGDRGLEFGLRDSGNAFWLTLKYTIDYSLKSRNMSAELQKRLLDEFDAVATLKANERDPTFRISFLQKWSSGREFDVSHWAATRPHRWTIARAGSTLRNDSFLHLAIQSQLLDYVKLSLDASKESLTPEALSSLLLVAVLYHRSDRSYYFHDSPSDYEFDMELDAQIVDLLLDYGANPNMKIHDALIDHRERGSFTPWEVAIAKMKPTRANWEPIMMSMLNHGADVSTLLRRRKNYSYAGPAQFVQIEKLARRNRREKRLLVVTNIFRGQSIRLKST